VSLGHPGLLSKLVTRIERGGPITFADFMEAALYDPDFGYYTTPGPRIGPDGDYYTSPDVHPIFAELIGKQIAQASEAMTAAGQAADEFTIVEMGAGKGLLARHMLSSYRREFPNFLSRLRYVIVERSAAMIAEQQRRLHPLLHEGAAITWCSDMMGIPEASLTGVILSNELVDAFPVHRVVKRPLGLREIYVGWADNTFIELEAPPFAPTLQEYFDRLGLSLEDGQRADVNLQAPDWMRQVGSRLRSGLVLTIDYGHTAADLFAPVRKTGTLLCYHRQTVSDSPYVRVGEQDLTAHVDFTSLALAGRDVGLAVTGFTNQLHFLMGLGIETAFADAAPESPTFAGMRQLLRPEGMGSTYKVLIQHKGMSAPSLDGLRSKPYFTDALYGSREAVIR
jgi:SAM-dependent MidA family methyltransferase